ncbi:MAG: hypothetical protein MJZ25_02090 [Fibrobacter sp.]|nr:hypothetical protein [Fibrobacter sp.]
MKKLIVMMLMFVCVAFSETALNFGFGPYHGMLGLEQTFLENKYSVNIHLANYDSDYDFLAGVGVAYHFEGLNGPYVFHSSEWIRGEKNLSTYTYKDGIEKLVSENIIDINYWRLVFGFGYQHRFYRHLSAYFEMGFEFYAGNGSYFLEFNQGRGTLDNDALGFPCGFGLSLIF